jgi:hypothetical protein
MSDLRHDLERKSERFDLAPGALDRFFEHRRRRQRNLRIRAGAVAIVVASVGTWGAISALRDLGTGQPAVSPTPSTGILEGEWRQDLLCEDVVATFHRLVNEQGRPGLFQRYVRDFAWGPGKDSARLTPKALCKGARDRYRIMRIGGGHITFFDPPTHEAEPVVTYQLVNDHTFTASDGGQNIEGTYRFDFAVVGDELTITLDDDDAWVGTAVEVAPYRRVR